MGSSVGQIARIKGARAVAGGPEKCRVLLEELGFDAAVDHRSPTFVEDLAAATPDGIEVYFENVGGPVFEAIVRQLNQFARIPVCGLIARYTTPKSLPPSTGCPTSCGVLTLSLTVRGFIHAEFEPTHHEAFLQEMGAWVRDGSVRYREDVVEAWRGRPRRSVDCCGAATSARCWCAWATTRPVR